MTTADKMNALLTAENARDWKTFVAEYVVLLTATKANRDCVEGYQVKKVKGGYQILWCGRNPGYGVMNADTAYSWFDRLPLVSFSREADDTRYMLLTA